MKKYLIYLVVFVVAITKVIGGSIPINLLFIDKQIVLGENYCHKELNDSISFDKIQFYISNIKFYKKGRAVYTYPKKFILIDAENPESMMLSNPLLDDIDYDRIKFEIGVDSVTNCSGAYGGDLDPTNGMYWTWQSGYINFKLEGKTTSPLKGEHDFTFHIGGYSHPNNSLRTIELINKAGGSSIDIAIDQFINSVDLDKTNKVMSPGKKAMHVADLLPSIFEVSK